MWRMGLGMGIGIAVKSPQDSVDSIELLQAHPIRIDEWFGSLNLQEQRMTKAVG